MNSKITLYSQKELITQVKAFAKENHTSVSKLVNNFFKTLVEDKNYNETKTQITDKLYGVLKDSKLDQKDYKDYLEKKYL